MGHSVADYIIGIKGAARYFWGDLLMPYAGNIREQKKIEKPGVFVPTTTNGATRL
jgi:hypothetical protein